MSADRDDDFVVQFKTQRQKTDCKNNQLSDYATINLNVNSVINGNVPYLASKDGCYMQSSVALFFKTLL